MTLVVDTCILLDILDEDPAFGLKSAQALNAKQANGQPYVERRQGLVDRSKTIWALVNPNDYEATMQ